MKRHECRAPVALRRFLNCGVELKTAVSLAQELDVLAIRRDFGGGHRRLRVGLGEAVEAEHPGHCSQLSRRDRIFIEITIKEFRVPEGRNIVLSEHYQLFITKFPPMLITVVNKSVCNFSTH